MTQLNWGNMAKDLNSNQTIPQAIAEAVTVHNDDPDAHIGPTRALESHRAAEIIDHRAESIVNDKIKPNARTYVAIVDDNSPADYDNIDDACAYAASLGGGSVFVRRGNYQINRHILAHSGIDIVGEGVGETVITRPAGSDYGFVITGGGSIDYLTFDTGYAYEGNDVIEVNFMSIVDWSKLDGAWVVSDVYTGYVHATGTDGQLQCDEPMAAEGTITALDIYPVLRSTAGSKIVTVAGSAAVLVWPVLDGTILASVGGGDFGPVANGSNIAAIELVNNAATTYESHGCSVYTNGTRRSSITGCTIDFSGTAPVFHNGYPVADIRVSYCEIKNFSRLSTYEMVGVEFNNVSFVCGAGVSRMGAYKEVYRNCEFDFSAAGGVLRLGGMLCIFENCHFGGVGSTGYNAFKYLVGGTHCYDCVSAGNSDGQLFNNYLDSPPERALMRVVIGCTITLRAYVDTTIYGKDLILNANIWPSASNMHKTLKIDTAAKHVILTNNLVYGVIAAAPAGNIAANNIDIYY